MRQIVVTGADGFVGTAAVRALGEDGERVLAVVRRDGRPRAGAAAVHAIGDLGQWTSWGAILRGADVILHLAARAHRADSDDSSALAEYRRVNRDATLGLARAAAAHGVRRFVLLSSIGVLGERTGDRPFRSSDAPSPQSPYAVSKAEAEEGLMTLAARTGLEIVIIRPPLVCGPGAPGNLRQLLRVAATPWPLPLGAMRNRRTFVGLANLLDLLRLALDHPNAPGQQLLVGDDDLVSTATLVRWMRVAMGRRARLFGVPEGALRRVSKVLGVGARFEKLAASLEVDSTATKRLLGWTPRVSTQESVSAMARAFVAAGT